MILTILIATLSFWLGYFTHYILSNSWEDDE